MQACAAVRARTRKRSLHTLTDGAQGPQATYVLEGREALRQRMVVTGVDVGGGDLDHFGGASNAREHERRALLAVLEI